MKRNSQSGFTLIELAIVMVIIGLLLGGILKGQEMITQGKIKNAISDFNGITAAYYSYLDRYKALPGDDLNAATRWAPAQYTGMTSGDGGGTVGGTFNSTTNNAESRQFWQHLRAAGLVNGLSSGATAQNQPLNFNGGTVGVQTGNGAVAPLQVLSNGGAAGTGFIGLILCSANLPDKVAIAIDNQLDDGSPISGNIHAQGAAGAGGAIGTNAINAYTETGSSFYDMCKAL